MARGDRARDPPVRCKLLVERIIDPVHSQGGNDREVQDEHLDGNLFVTPKLKDYQT